MKLTIYSDGGSRGNPGPAGAGVVIQDARGGSVLEAGYFLGDMTNNMAEYHALLRGLAAAERLGASELQIYCDSELLVKQINGEYRVRNESLKDLFDDAIGRLRRIGRWKIQHIRRDGNSRADELANMAMDAREDVIDISTGPSSGESGGDSFASGIVVRCMKAPDSAVCPAPCKMSTQYQLNWTTPAGLCLHAAPAILAAWKKMAEGAPAADVDCPSKCGARFHLTFEE